MKSIRTKCSRGVGMDSRINPHFFRSGIGFGGSCFPKDIHALISFAESQGIDTQDIESSYREQMMTSPKN